MPIRTPEPGTFESKLQPVQVDVTSLVRLSKYPRTEPWWSRGAARFDGPVAGAPGSFGTCYAAFDVATAFAESVIHDNTCYIGGGFQVPLRDLHARSLVTFDRPGQRILTLADFTGDALRRLGLNNDISAGADYGAPMAWARAVHEAKPGWDGILYVSRQSNLKQAVALFERSAVQLSSHSPLEQWVLDELCDRFGVVGI